MFKEKRLVFMAGPEGPGADDVIKNIESKTAVEKTAAAALKDEKVLWSESADKGVVKEFIDGVQDNVTKAIPNHLVKATADSAFKEYKNNPNAGTDALGGINKAFGEADAAAFNKAKNDAYNAAVDSLPLDGKHDKEISKRADAAVLKVKPEDHKAKWPEAKAMAIKNKAFPNAPKPLADAIGKARNQNEVIDICKQFKTNWEKAKAEADAAKKIDDHGKQLIVDMKGIAVTAVHEQQQYEFNRSRVVFISIKADKLVPAPKLAKGQKELTPEQQQKLTEARGLAVQYLNGMMSKAELKVGKEAIKKELEAEFSSMPVDIQKKFIASVQVAPDKREGEVYNSDALVNASPAIKAHVEGLLDSTTGDPKQRAKMLAHIQRRINQLPKSERNNLLAVETALSTIHQEADTDKKWRTVEITNEDRKEKIDGNVNKASVIMKEHPEVGMFFKQRMAKANELFKGQPGHEANMRKYRNTLLSSISRLDPKNINRAVLDAIPLPSTFEAGAAISKDFPSDLKPATRMLPGTGAYALKLMKQLKRQGAPKGTIIKFKYKHKSEVREYYGEYTGNNLIIFTSPPSQPKQDEAPGDIS